MGKYHSFYTGKHQISQLLIVFEIEYMSPVLRFRRLTRLWRQTLKKLTFFCVGAPGADWSDLQCFNDRFPARIGHVQLV